MKSWYIEGVISRYLRINKDNERAAFTTCFILDDTNAIELRVDSATCRIAFAREHNTHTRNLPRITCASRFIESVTEKENESCLYLWEVSVVELKLEDISHTLRIVSAQLYISHLKYCHRTWIVGVCVYQKNRLRIDISSIGKLFDTHTHRRFKLFENISNTTWTVTIRRLCEIWFSLGSTATTAHKYKHNSVSVYVLCSNVCECDTATTSSRIVLLGLTLFDWSLARSVFAIIYMYC